jgi:parallel beta-helix repeat protein
MPKSGQRAYWILAISAILLTSVYAGAAGSLTGRTAAEVAPGAPTSPAGTPVTPLGGPAPSLGSPSCPGSIPYSNAQIVVLPNGTVYPYGSTPLSRSGAVYTLQTPVDTSILFLGANATLDGSNCLLSYATVGGDGNKTAVEVRLAHNVTVEYFDITGAPNAGVFVNHSADVTVFDSSMEHCTGAGLNSEFSQDLNFTSNNDSYSGDGIYLYFVTDSVVQSNQFFDTLTSVWLQQDVGTSVLRNDGALAGDYGAYLDENSATLVEGNDFAKNQNGTMDAAGIYDDFGSSDIFSDNNLSGNQAYGAYLDAVGGTSSFNDNDLAGGVYCGIYEYDTYYGGFLNIVGNDIQNTTTFGIYDYEGGVTNITANDLSSHHPDGDAIAIDSYYVYGSTNIVGNRIDGPFYEGMYLYSDGPELTVDGNVVENVTYSGIEVYDAYATTVAGNTLLENRSLVSSIGLYIYYENGYTQVEHNLITGGWVDAIYAYYPTAGLTISDNFLANATAEAVYIYYTYGGVQLVGNDATANATTSADSPYGFYFYEPYDDQTISGNDLSGGYFYGIFYYYEFGSATILDNVVTDCTSIAIYFEKYALGSVTLEGNDVSISNTVHTVDGISVYETYSNLTATDNLGTGGLSTGLYVGESGGVATVSGNIFSNTTSHGIEFGASDDGLLLADNDVAANRTSSSTTSYGAYLDGASGDLLAVTGNNASGGVGTGIYLEDAYDAANVLDSNDLSGTRTYGVYLDLALTPTIVSDNNLRHSGGYGIYDYDSENVTIQDNSLEGSNVAINASDFEMPSLIEGNNATGSNISLELYSKNFEAPIDVIGNDFSDARAAYVNDTWGGFTGNTFLGTPLLGLTHDLISEFYHNNVQTGAGNTLNLTATSPSSGVFNAALPIGGNFWTGYTPTRCTNDICSPAYLVPSLLGSSGYYDEYPLGRAWTNYAITFAESGLPAGAPWAVVVDSTTYASVAPSSVEYFPQNAQPVTYSYSIPAAGSYTIVSPATGTFTASGAAQTIPVAFSEPGFAVTFTESGLAAGATWHVNSTGTPSFLSAAFSVTSGTGQSFALGNLTNGTYGFTVTVSPSGYRTTTATAATFTVSGKAVTVSYAYTYSPTTYAVTFTETGLPSGASWTVTLAGAPQSATGPTITFTEPNGSFSYTVAVPSGYSVNPASGQVTVSGGPVATYVTASSTSAATSSTSVNNAELYGLLAGLAAAAVLAGLGWALYLRRKGGGGSTSTAPPPAWSPPPGSPGAPPSGATSPPPPPAAGGPENIETP